MSYARRLLRVVSWVPGAAPAGRGEVKRPATYTVSSTTACDQATPSIWTVGSESAVTVVGVSGSAGFSGAESARATPGASTPPRTPPTTAALATPATSDRTHGRVDI